MTRFVKLENDEALTSPAFQTQPQTVEATQKERFGGIARLLGREGLERLNRAHVCVIGLGGVGSWSVEALARSGIGTLTLIDMDDVCITNVNRQLPALENTVGMPKAQVLAARVKAIHPDCLVTAQVEYLLPSNAEKILGKGFDYVIDAVDRSSIKALIVARCRDFGRPVLTVGGAGGKRGLQPVQCADLNRSGGDPLLRQTRRILRHDYAWDFQSGTPSGVTAIFSTETPVYPMPDGSCSTQRVPGDPDLQLDCSSGLGSATFVTGQFGFAAAGEVVRQLAG